MRVRDLQRAYKWAEINQSEDLLAAYYFNVCLVLGTLVDILEVPRGLRMYKHCEANDALVELRD